MKEKEAPRGKETKNWERLATKTRVVKQGRKKKVKKKKRYPQLALEDRARRSDERGRTKRESGGGRAQKWKSFKREKYTNDPPMNMNLKRLKIEDGKEMEREINPSRSLLRERARRGRQIERRGKGEGASKSEKGRTTKEGDIGEGREEGSGKERGEKRGESYEGVGDRERSVRGKEIMRMDGKEIYEGDLRANEKLKEDG
ncbi:hypothetical protein Tco_1562938 [Tanacetum coccineum]